ncbi:LEAF RUST 10 DISEASE-RESISTANCE LOCUS RECEPTOR-LIKE PROTEIN KINASE-like 2.7 isoform X2 [Malania oleifera]|uniref:LEAF RUST 10 DISEASE-RESISTANCE LOCUS RECEPTOR-LIKE PROTEIN KINASE-like 2.7 isoform X2 n=1 Tax=Malania oleifera TaxID=397392 RepID=UPI0025ADC9F4|nr:LEAF RUST 10 DISEASE-RESISTANCE LOCUS RECEPTOR-LIKE PROTEIN KINASE-like 2.7 isoform X2 [Malania oleifera]
MNFQIFSSFLSLFSIIELLVLIRIPLCLCHVDELYSQCEKKFSCGDTIKDVGYPFWGEGQRPMKCGLPGFELICDERSKITTMPIMGVTYRVIELGYPILKIAREDVLEMPEGSCPTYLNDSILDLQHFDYHPYHDEYVNITLLYNCPAATTGEPLIEIHKPCKINDSSYTSVLPIPQPQSQAARRFHKCIVGITFPIRQIDLKELGDLLGLSGVLRRGFEVMWKLKEDENNACEECTQSKGLCGYNYSSSTTACVCPNPPYFTRTKCHEGHPRKIFIVGIARGLEYLHRGCATRILHFDIKPHNILLDEYFCPKISDFGLSKLCHGKESIVSMMDARGTFGYIAPEVYCRNFGGVSYKSDVYSYGMLVLEMVGGRRNINVERSHTSEIYFPNWIYKHLDLEEDLRLLEVVTAEEEEMARKMILVSLWCIQTIPSDRPSMTKVVEMLEGSLQSLSIPPKPTLSSP